MKTFPWKTNYISSQEAVDLLKIKPKSLYSYVSRGWIQSIAGNHPRERLYSVSDIQAVLLRQKARSGHGPVAGAAIRFGEPILESSITRIAEGTLWYRGKNVIEDLIKPNIRFENVAEFLWSGTFVDIPIVWNGFMDSHMKERWHTIFRAAASFPDPKNRMAAFISGLSLAGEKELDPRPDQNVILCRHLYRGLATLIVYPFFEGIQGDICLSSILAQGWNVKTKQAEIVLNQALLACADHELNPSAFVARIAASNGVDLLLCLEAAFATHRGTKQGLTSDALEKLILDAEKEKEPIRFFEEQWKKEPSFSFLHHPLYPQGDPRGRILIELANEFSKKSLHPRFSLLKQLILWMNDQLGEQPNVDMGLLAISFVLGLPSQSASTLYCLSRFCGWVAHILEQRCQNFQIRPRAKYI